ncbi:MAG: DUF4202 domain-containing protein [Opitutaceae bacterium]|nr:DUF4202 domain-containing protein [Opitutaceae bacterium]
MIPETDMERIESAAARMADAVRFMKAIQSIDLLNDVDRKRVTDEGRDVGYELYFSRLLFAKTLSLNSEASEALLLAARAQHVSRWKMPRSDFPIGRAGYLKWRSDLKRYHATVAADVLGDAGYDKATIDQVRTINLKENLKSNPDAQTMEDALCLVFLEVQFSEFRLKTSEEKIISILRKTWGKMSDRGQKAALALELGEKEARLIGLALGADE